MFEHTQVQPLIFEKRFALDSAKAVCCLAGTVCGSMKLDAGCSSRSSHRRLNVFEEYSSKSRLRRRSSEPSIKPAMNVAHKRRFSVESEQTMNRNHIKHNPALQVNHLDDGELTANSPLPCYSSNSNRFSVYYC